MPPLSDYAEWLVGITRRIGFSRGDSSTGFGEIRHWCELSGIQLTLWECEMVSGLSSIFMSATHRYREDKEALPPWLPEGERERLAEQLAEFDADFGPTAASRKVR